MSDDPAQIPRKPTALVQDTKAGRSQDSSNVVSAQLIRTQGRELQGISIDDRRCEELALEVDKYNRAVADAASDLEFEDEPARFTTVLSALRQGPPE